MSRQLKKLGDGSGNVLRTSGWTYDLGICGSTAMDYPFGWLVIMIIKCTYCRYRSNMQIQDAIAAELDEKKNGTDPSDQTAL